MQEFPEIQEEYKDVKLLFFYSTSAYQIHTPKKAIYTKEDLEGRLIRVGGPVDKAIAEALGGVPEFMHMPDTYLALSKGVLDAHMSPFGPMKGDTLSYREREPAHQHLRHHHEFGQVEEPASRDPGSDGESQWPGGCGAVRECL